MWVWFSERGGQGRNIQGKSMMLSRDAPRLYNVSVSMGFTVSMVVARFNAYGVSVAGAVQRFKDSSIQQFDNLKI